MNPGFFGACKFRTTQATWVCGLVQPADLRPLQRAYGKRSQHRQEGAVLDLRRAARPRRRLQPGRRRRRLD
jgi:hypothetical protein